MATKVQRVVGLSTPPRQQYSTKQHQQQRVYSDQEKTSLLENFDLEVEDKTRAFKSCLQTQLTSFLLRQETEILKIPRDLRTMTLKELESKWGGSWAGTVQKIARDKIQERERIENEQKEKMRLEEEMNGKRKRAEEGIAASSPNRSNKNARKNVPGSAQKIPQSASKKRLAVKTPRGKLHSGGQGPSTLPQDHVFNPLLPTTPGFARRARRNESFFSANGSPITIGEDDDNARRPNVIVQKEYSGGETEDDGESDTDLPDPEAYEAELLSRLPNKQEPRRPKRGPSLVFRQSLLPTLPIDQESTASIELSDGSFVTFDPLNLSPGRIDKEMEQGGIGEVEKAKVKGQVKDAVFMALQAKMEKWKLLG